MKNFKMILLTIATILALLAHSGSPHSTNVTLSGRANNRACQRNKVRDLGTPPKSMKTYTYIPPTATGYSYHSAKEACECLNLNIATILLSDEPIPQPSEWNFLGNKFDTKAFSGWYWVGGKDYQDYHEFKWEEEEDLNLQSVSSQYPFKTYHLSSKTCLLYLSSSAPSLGPQSCDRILQNVGVLCQAKI